VCHYQLLKLNVTKANVPIILKRKPVPHVCRSQKRNHVINRKHVHGNQERGAKRAHVIRRRVRLFDCCDWGSEPCDLDCNAHRETLDE